MAGVIPGNKIYGDMSTADAVRTMSLDADNAKVAAAVDNVATGQVNTIRQRTWGLAARVDTTVSFEEYIYWAEIEREMEAEENKKFKAARGPRTLTNIIKSRFSTGKQPPSESSDDKERRERAIQPLDEAKRPEDKQMQISEPSASSDPVRVTDEEWRTAARALRTASWSTIFYLITTDILGWSSCPFVFATVGYGAGVALYVVFGLFAGFSGYCIWRVFLGLDSSRYPMLSFGDTYFRIYGPKARHFINVTQSIQQFFTVAVLVLGCSTTIAQVNKEQLCFIVVMIIVMVIGMVFGSIRSLQRLGWLCNLSVWLNIACFIIIMYASANNPIDYQVVTKSTLIKTIEPVRTFASRPPAQYQQQATGFASQFNAVDSMVYAYSGALLFVAFLGEMRNPWDFWKGLFLAQGFICFVYILFGVFVYSNFGQYSASNIGNVIQPFGLQTAQNIIALLTSFFAIFLYFNIGMKTVYLEVFQEIFNFPAITTRKGQWCWYALGPIYWILAFVVAAAVPNLNGIVNLVGGLFGLNFTYSLPGIMFVGYLVQRGASLPGEGFDPVTGQTTRHDSGAKRWVRGYKKHLFINTFTTLYFLAGLACSGMGTWAAIEGLIQVFGPGGTVATSFGCAVPV
ncbi:amino acid transporter-like protein [Hortaea werneckii]|nr:amino acid transporter-like protein [Hortaea werneckii]KAI7110069.1 amino acid transporter-like protein [Hortaea werneckii]KAI7225504.1 amino acid transporter-like protein [Hortaea werneckii]KAI7333613.1 amino acid transporter-like protein [Hortaea werneckii]KAI7383002.1 amino acid transporter-like protein [Hortaea werneckii]